MKSVIFKESGVYTQVLGEIIMIESITHSSSDGNLGKWKVQQVSTGKYFWLKESSVNNGEVMFECESECFCSNFAKILGISYIMDYRMDVLYLGKKAIKVCLSEHYNFDKIYLYADMIPNVGNLYGGEKYTVVTELIPGVHKEIDKVMLFDIIVANNDRHLHNLAYDMEENDILLFDNGASLFSNTTDKILPLCLKQSFEYQKCRPFFDTVGKQIMLVNRCDLLPITYEQLNRLITVFIPKSRRKFVYELLERNLRKVGDFYGVSLLRK